MTDSPRLIAGRYQLGDLLGRGGMADVYLGTDARLGRRVAIKLLKSSLATDPAFRVRFRQEAQAAARMAHPTIVRVFDAGEETVTDADGLEAQVPFIVMEYVDGRLLKDIIAEGPLESAEAIRIIQDILTALEYSHRAGVVHRDIKPGNIMITQKGQVKVMDFGIARAISTSSATVAEPNAVFGTAQYFSPEQARGESMDARTDLYSTGVVLFELLTGRPPFTGDTPVAVAFQHVSQTPPTPSTFNPKISPALDAVVLRALAKDRYERFQSAAEFRNAVDAAILGQAPTRQLPPSDFTATLFGVNPSAVASSEAAFKQLDMVPDSPEEADERALTTQNRPPVAWVWAGVTIMIAVLIAVILFVLNLTPTSFAQHISVVVPNVAGQSYSAGSATLTKARLVPSSVPESSSTVANGLIVRTDPPSGLRVSPGSPIKVYVSTGKAAAIVPQLSLTPAAAAQAALSPFKLALGQITFEHSPSVPKGVITRTDPAGGTSVFQGDTVNLFVSDGLVKVPKVIGDPLAQANSILSGSSLQLAVSFSPDRTCTGGTVSSQSLAPGDQPQKSSIVLGYCAGQAAAPSPSPSGSTGG